MNTVSDYFLFDDLDFLFDETEIVPSPDEPRVSRFDFGCHVVGKTAFKYGRKDREDCAALCRYVPTCAMFQWHEDGSDLPCHLFVGSHGEKASTCGFLGEIAYYPFRCDCTIRR